MADNVRPESMERITTAELANKFIDEQVELIKAQVGDKKVLLALSGGVDSSVLAALLMLSSGCADKNVEKEKEVYRVLFIGNSYTHFNNMPDFII